MKTLYSTFITPEYLADCAAFQHKMIKRMNEAMDKEDVPPEELDNLAKRYNEIEKRLAALERNHFAAKRLDRMAAKRSRSENSGFDSSDSADGSSPDSNETEFDFNDPNYSVDEDVKRVLPKDWNMQRSFNAAIRAIYGLDISKWDVMNHPPPVDDPSFTERYGHLRRDATPTIQTDTLTAPDPNAHDSTGTAPPRSPNADTS